MLDERSKYLRRQIIRALEGGGRGHVGPSFSLVEIMRVLYDDVIGPEDTVILSKGHGCLAQYVMLVEKGLIDAKELDVFCRAGAMLGGHPEHHIPGVRVSTGSLGHGLSLGIGMALASRDSRVFVVVGDGECNEGSIWEAALCAGKHQLSNLTVIVDYNKRQSYDTVEQVQPLEPFAEKWKAFGFEVVEADGHDADALRQGLDRGLCRVCADGPSRGHIWRCDLEGKGYHSLCYGCYGSTRAEHVKARPLCIIAHTVKGKGVPEVENHPFWHHKDVFTAEDGARLRAAL